MTTMTSLGAAGAAVASSLESPAVSQPENQDSPDVKIAPKSRIVTVLSCGANLPAGPGSPSFAQVGSSRPPFRTMGIDSRDRARRH